MGSEDGLVEIHPRELQFLFEVKKQSSCSVHLVNKTDEYVAFKVKTTSPKRYCVRPNTGVILPRATRDFTVTMQAQRTAPPDLQIKDKFLVQTTVVPSGTSNEGIFPSFFSKESRRYVEENKLRVVLVSATQPEVEQLINGVPNAKTAVEVPVAKETLNIVNEVPSVVNEVPHPLKASFPPLRETPAILSKIPLPEKETPTVLRDFPIPSKEAPAISTESALHLKETPTVSVESHFSSTETSVALKESPPPLKDTSAPKEVAILSDGLTNAENLHLSHVTEDYQNLKSKINNLEVKLEEAENLIIKLREETRTTIKEQDKLLHEMGLVAKEIGVRGGRPDSERSTTARRRRRMRQSACRRRGGRQGFLEKEGQFTESSRFPVAFRRVHGDSRRVTRLPAAPMRSVCVGDEAPGRS